MKNLKVWQAAILWVVCVVITACVVKAEIALGKIVFGAFAEDVAAPDPFDAIEKLNITNVGAINADDALTISGTLTLSDSATAVINVDPPEMDWSYTFQGVDVYMDLKPNPAGCKPHLLHIKPDGTLAVCPGEKR